jgi:hypothetical protein
MWQKGAKSVENDTPKIKNPVDQRSTGFSRALPWRIIKPGDRRIEAYF